MTPTTSVTMEGNSQTLSPSINVFNIPSPPTTFAHPALSADAVLETLRGISTAPANLTLARLTQAYAHKKSDIRNETFIPLAYFLPASKATALSSPLTDNMTDDDLKQAASLAIAHATLQPEAAAQKEQNERDAVTRFKGFEDICQAFLGGLVPLTCKDKPLRLLDYITFFTGVQMQHATGHQHWPVLLHLIETVRERSPSGEAHRLSPRLEDSNGYVDKEILNEARQLWNDSGARGTFLRHFADLSALTALLNTPNAEARRVTRDYAPPSGSPAATPRVDSSATRTRPTAPPGLTSADWAQISSLGDKVCRKHLLKSCTANPCNRPHLSMEDVRGLLRPSGSAATATSN
jgi:hypothetical protein